MREEVLPEISPSQQNVRVGDRLAQRYRGIGVKFNIGDEFVKSRQLGHPTFKAAYGGRRTDGYDLLTRVLPDGQTKTILLRKDSGVCELVYEGVLEERYPGGMMQFYGPNSDKSDEIVVIPNGVFQTPELIALLPESTIAQDFEELLGRLSPGKR